MISIDLRTKNCFVCGEEIADCSRVESGHVRATDCFGVYIGITTSYHDDAWKDGACYRTANAAQDEEGGERGCRGPYEEWMGVEVAREGEAPFDVKRRNP